MIIPVRNEARRLPATLRALAAQVGFGGAPFDPRRYEVIVLANNCTDASADAVRRFAARQPHLAIYVVEARFPRHVSHVGHARACLMNEACERLARTAGDGGVIASTDGDTQVAPDWLAATLAEVAAGAEAVGGRIVTGDDSALPPALMRLARRDETYQRLRVRLEHALDPDQADPWPRHHQHFGASLAVTVRAYRRVGGLPPEPFLEDEALYQALRRHDLNVRHSDRVSVVTSSRRAGRVAVGLSWQLREWAARAAANEDARVADPARWADTIVLRRRLRRCWQVARNRAKHVPSARHDGTVERIADKLGVPASWLGREAMKHATFGALWHAVEMRCRRAARRPQHVELGMSEAIASLRAMLARAQRVSASRKDRAARCRA